MAVYQHFGISLPRSSYSQSGCGQAVSYENAQPGDIIQYVVDGWAHHSVIVTKLIYDDDGNVVDLLINSNTTDRVDYPMSAYGYTDIRLIKIIGYNDK